MTRRTSLNLDLDLVAAASDVLGTARTTDTIHAAMREVVARAKRASLARRDFAGLTPERVASLRQPRGRR